MVLGALGTAGVIVSMFLSWRTGSVHPSEVPAAFLWDRTTTSSSPSLLIFLIPFAVVLGVGAFLPMGRGLRLLGGIGTLAVTGLFAYQLYRVTDSGGGDLWDTLDIGFYVAAVAGFLGFVSGFVPSGWARRRTVDRTVHDGRDRRDGSDGGHRRAYDDARES